MAYLIPKVWPPGKINLRLMYTINWFLYLVGTHCPNWYNWSLEHCLDMSLPASTLWNSDNGGSSWGSARHHFMAFTHLQGSKWHLRRLQAFPMPPLQLVPHLLSDFTPHQQSLLFKVAKQLQVKWEHLDLYLWSIALSVNWSGVANGRWDDLPSTAVPIDFLGLFEQAFSLPLAAGWTKEM